MVPILTKHRANQREGRQNLKKTVLPVVNYEVEKLGCLDSSMHAEHADFHIIKIASADITVSS